MVASWQIGDRIENRWEIYHILRGGMGIVYIVYDHDFRGPFAAKTFQGGALARNPAIAVSLNRFSSTSACTRWRSIPVRPGNQDRTAAANPNVGSIPARAAEPLHLNSLQVRNLAGSCSPFPANDLTCPNENCASFCPLCGAMIA